MTERETAKEPRKVESPKEENAETKGKEKVKERKDNVPTKPQNHQKSSGQVGLGNNSEQSWNAEAHTSSWQDDDWYTADPNSQTSAAAEEFQHASICDLRHSNLGFAKHIESVQSDRLDLSQRTITFGIDTAACKTVVPANHPATRGYLIQKDSLLRCAYSTAGRDKVYDQGKRILCTLDGTGKPNGH